MVRVPDGIEPLVGYRCWSYTVTPDGVSLFPLSLFGSVRSVRSSWAGAESRWVEPRRRARAPDGRRRVKTGAAVSICEAIRALERERA